MHADVKLIHTESSSLLDHHDESIDSITQQSWYIKHLSKYVCEVHIHHRIIRIPIKKQWTGWFPFIPAMLQKIEMGNSFDANMQETLVWSIFQKYPCGNISFPFSIKNLPQGVHCTPRSNYVLRLDQPHSELYRRYNRSHKENLKIARKKGISISCIMSSEEFVGFYQMHAHPTIPSEYKKTNILLPVISKCMDLKQGFMIGAKNSSGQWLAMAFLSHYHNRIVYHLSCVSDEGRNCSAMFPILDHLIEKFAQTDNVLDFEGSMIPGVAYFMKGFGSLDEKYYLYSWNRSFACKFMDRIRKLKNWCIEKMRK